MSTLGTAPARRFPWTIYMVILMIILVLAALPLVLTLIGGSLASANGCQLDEGSIHPCIIAGVDRGELVYTLGMMGWLMLASLPLGVVALGIWVFVLVIHRVGFYRRGRS